MFEYITMCNPPCPADWLVVQHSTMGATDVHLSAGRWENMSQYYLLTGLN